MPVDMEYLTILSYIRCHNKTLFDQIAEEADRASVTEPQKWSENTKRELVSLGWHRDNGLPEPSTFQAKPDAEIPYQDILSFLWCHNKALHDRITEEAERRSVNGPSSWDTIVVTELKKLGWHNDLEEYVAM